MWSRQLDRKWDQLEQVARSMSIGRDVLIAVRFEEVEDDPEAASSYTTLLGLKQLGDQWHICMGRGPDEVPYWEPVWQWSPRADWTRPMSVEAAGHITEFVEVLAAAAEVVTAEVEEAAALVTQAIHRLG